MVNEAEKLEWYVYLERKRDGSFEVQEISSNGHLAHSPSPCPYIHVPQRLEIEDEIGAFNYARRVLERLHIPTNTEEGA